MLIDRDYELNFLEEQYKNKTGSFIIVYGRRRIGKTFLINEFTKNKPNIYLLGTREIRIELIKKFSMKISEFFNDEIISKNPLTSWDSIFEYIIDKTVNIKNRLLIIIDEITYIISVDKSFLSIFQKYYDTELKNRNLMFILSGSLINIVYNDILSYSSPLYGRRTGNIKLEEFKFSNVYRYFNYMDMKKTIEIYSIFGGMPYYLSLINSKKSIINQYICPGNIFYNDAEFILREELSNPERYFTILKLIASGKNSISEMANIMEYRTNELSPYLDKLASMGTIKKEYPAYAKKRNNGVYKINSNYFNFYFKFIFENQEYINEFKKNIIINIINKNLNKYVSKIFEDICREFLMENSGKIINSDIIEMGKWWGKNRNKEKGYDNEEIDILGRDLLNRYIFGEVKYKNKKADINILNELKRKSSIFDFDNKLYIIFSYSGFNNDLITVSSIEKNVILIDGKKMENLLKK